MRMSAGRQLSENLANNRASGNWIGSALAATRPFRDIRAVPAIS